MAQKRRKDQIISQILDLCLGGVCKTRIVYLANLNFKTINPYLENLVANELLEAIDGPTVVYRTTEKGAQVLDLMKRIENLMPIKMSYSQSI